MGVKMSERAGFGSVFLGDRERRDGRRENKRMSDNERDTRQRLRQETKWGRWRKKRNE